MTPVSQSSSQCTLDPCSFDLREEQISAAETILENHFEFYCTSPENAHLKEKFQRSIITTIISCGDYTFVINSNAQEMNSELKEIKKELRMLMSRPPLEYVKSNYLHITTALIAKNDDGTHDYTASHHILSPKGGLTYYCDDVADMPSLYMKLQLHNLVSSQEQRDQVSHWLRHLLSPKEALFEKNIAKAMRIVSHNFFSHHLNLISNDPFFPKKRHQSSAIVLVMKNHDRSIFTYGTTDHLTANLRIIHEDLRALIYDEWNAHPDNDCITMDMLCFERLEHNTYDCEAYVDKFSLFSEDNYFSDTTKKKLTQFELGPLLYEEVPSFEFLMEASTTLAELKVP